MTIFGAGFSPLSSSPRLGLIPIPDLTVTSGTITNAAERTFTAAELLGGFLTFDVQDAQNGNLPTAELLIAQIPGVTGTAQSTGACGFYFDIKNSGDSTLTIVAGTGGTVTGTATVITAEVRRFLMVITNGVKGSATYTCYCLQHSTF
jgi:hypothetical protein